MIKKKTTKYTFLALLIIFALGFSLYEAQGRGIKKRLVVVTYNVGTFNHEKPPLNQVVDAISRKGTPDLVLLQEVPNKTFLLGIALGLGLPYQSFAHPKTNGSGYGLAIISKWPLFNPEVHSLNPYGHGAFLVKVRIGPREVLVCSVHLERIRPMKKNKEGFELTWKKAFRILKTELTSETPRSIAVRNILALPSLQRCDTAIIAGDFNAVPFTTAIRAMEASYEDALWPTIDYFTGTYRKVIFPVKPRIDYIFHSHGMKCLSASVIKDGVGDHYPVRAVLDVG